MGGGGGAFGDDYAFENNSVIELNFIFLCLFVDC